MILEGGLDFSIVQYPFFQNALLLSLLAAIPSAIIGTYIVVKRISMMTGSISHSCFGGLGIAYFLSWNPLLGAMIFGLASGGSVAVLQRKAKNRLDTILSFLWAFGMSIGLLFLYLTPGYSSDLFSYLFGNIFLISNADMTLLIVLDVIIIGTVMLLFQTFKAVLFDTEYAEVRNMPILLINVIFYLLVALTIIVILSIVGIILLIAFLTLPAAIAQFYERVLTKIMALAAIIIIVVNVAGLFIGHFLSVPPGPIIILILSFLYVMSLVGDQVKNRIKNKKNDIPPHACDVELDSFDMFKKYIDFTADNGSKQV